MDLIAQDGKRIAAVRLDGRLPEGARIPERLAIARSDREVLKDKGAGMARVTMTLAPKGRAGELRALREFMRQHNKALKIRLGAPGQALFLTPEPAEGDAIVCWVSTGGAAAAPAPAPAPKRARPIAIASASAPPPAQRRRVDVPAAGEASLAAAVAKHYNAHTQEHEAKDAVQRDNSNVIHLRRFNNWTKSMLIKLGLRYLPQAFGASVLDLACGKGGDLNKWRRVQVSNYVGVDIALRSVQAALQRYNELESGRHGHFPARFLAADLGALRLTDVPAAEGGFRDADAFDVVSIQFAMHYLFESEARCDTFFHNVSARLKPGGVFVATTTDANVLVRLLRQGVHGAAEPGVALRNAVCTLKFAPRSVERLAAPRLDSPFGLAYTFTLEDSVDELEEFLAPLAALQDVAGRHGLELVFHKNFHDFYTEMAADPDNVDLLYKMRVFTNQGRFSPEEWAVERLYMVVVLRKLGSSAGVGVPGAAPAVGRPMDVTEVANLLSRVSS